MVISTLLQSAILAILLQTGFQVPTPVGLVNDFAGVIPSDRVPLLTQIAEDVRTKSRGEIAIVTLTDLKGLAPVDAAVRIGRTWKVGGSGEPGDVTRNAGAVILIVPKETSPDNRGYCFVAPGRGAEGFITDATSGSLCREATPYFRAGDYGAGITLITFRVAERFAREFNFALDSALRPVIQTREPSGQGGRGFPPQFIFLAIVVVLLMLGGGGRGRGGRGGRGGGGTGNLLPLAILLGSQNRGGWGGSGSWGGGGFGGGGGGGFGGFGGGGGFSGGGGGSSW